MRVLPLYPINLPTHRGSFDVFLFGDIHWGAPTCDEDAVHRVVDAIVENKKTRITRTILMGDYGNCYTQGDPRRSMGDQKKEDALEVYTEIRDLLKPIASTVVSCTLGNHDEDWIKRERIDYVNWICAELKMPYGEYENYVIFKVKTPGANRRNVEILAWHGTGGGRTVGGAFNKARNPIDCFRTPDIVAMGHLHRLGMTMEEYMVPNEKTLDVDSAEQYFVLTGGFLKGYQPPKSTYISKKMLPPVAIGAVKLVIQPFRDIGGRDALDVVCHVER